MFLVSFALFYLGTWTRSRPSELWLLTLVVLLVDAAVVVAQTLTGAAARGLPRPGPATPPVGDSFTLVIWLLSMPALAAQLAIIDMLGGLIGYINALGDRMLVAADQN